MSLTSNVIYIGVPARVDLQVADLPTCLSSVLDVYNVVLHGQGELGLLVIPPSGEIDLRSSLQAEFTVNRENCVTYSIDGPRKAVGVFQLLQVSLNTFCEPRELSAGMDHLHNTIRSSEAQIQPFYRPFSSNALELESVCSEVGQLEAYREEVSRQISFSQAAFIATGFERDETWTLVDVEAQKCQDFKEISAKVCPHLDDHFSLFRSRHKMFCYDGDRALCD